MLLWAAIALADSGSGRCTMRGLPLDISWTESGSVAVRDAGDVIVSFDVGKLDGVTTLHCNGEAMQFITDTQKIPGRFSLEKVKVELTDILDTVDPARFEAAAARAAVAKAGSNTTAKTTGSRTPSGTASKTGTKGAASGARAGDMEGLPPELPRPEHNGQAAAEGCVNTKVWEAYDEGWRVRSVTSEVLDPGERQNLALQLLEGNTYRFVGCAQSSVRDLDLLVYDESGRVVALDRTDDRQPSVDFVPKVSGTVHIVLIQPGGNEQVGVALGVLHR